MASKQMTSATGSTLVERNTTLAVALIGIIIVILSDYGVWMWIGGVIAVIYGLSWLIDAVCSVILRLIAALERRDLQKAKRNR